RHEKRESKLHKLSQQPRRRRGSKALPRKDRTQNHPPRGLSRIFALRHTRLSVKINRIATVRNSRRGNKRDWKKMALDCIRIGAEGIAVHARPDDRHIRDQDVRDIRPLLNVELNIEGKPQEPRFCELVLEVKPDQVTLVPDAPGQITSNHGWDTERQYEFLL